MSANEPMESFGKAGGASLLRYAAWKERLPWLSAGMTTRLGGTSRSPWNSLNCGLHVGDDPLHVVDNRRRAAEAAGFSLTQWTCAEQVHGNEVGVVTAEMAGAGSTSLDDAIAAKDALVTNVPRVMLSALYADCVPILFADPVQRAVGIAHAGWRGTATGVAAATVQAFVRTYGTAPSDLHAALGPSIRGCCYEVGEEVAQRFKDAPKDSLSLLSPGRYRLDLVKILRQQLTEAGILPNNIEITMHCTSCRVDLFFSHRKEQGRTGRMAAWIARKE